MPNRVEVNQSSRLSVYNSELENLIERASQYDLKPLSDSDFEVSYNDFTIRYNTTPDSFQDNLGYPEDFLCNNRGNISTGNGYGRWELSYPDFTNPDVRIILLSVQEIDENGNEYHGDTYMVGIDMMTIETHRSLRAGDTIDRVFDLYGQPTII